MVILVLVLDLIEDQASFSFPGGGFGQNVLIFGVDMNSSAHIDNTKRDILVNVNVNSNNPIFYPFSVRTSTSSGNCNNINDPYARICVPDIVKI